MRKSWVEPAIGWGVRIDGEHATYLIGEFQSRRPIVRDVTCQFPVRVALVPLAVARKAGLLRRPK